MKKFTKNLSIIIALCMVITIGGVYAAWSYNDNAMNTVSESFAPNMQDYIGSSVNGSITVAKDSVDIRVTDNVKNGTPVADPDNDAGDHLAELDIAGEILLILKPYDGATKTPDQITLKYSVTAPDASYNGTPIFAIDTGLHTVTGFTKIADQDAVDALNATITIEANKLDASDIGSYYITIGASDLESVISLNGNFVLDTLDEYHEFQTAMGGKSFTIEISEYVAP